MALLSERAPPITDREIPAHLFACNPDKVITGSLSVFSTVKHERFRNYLEGYKKHKSLHGLLVYRMIMPELG